MDIFHHLFVESDKFLVAPFQSNISFHSPKHTMWASFQEVGSLEVYTCDMASLPLNSFTEMFVYATKNIVLQDDTVCFTSLAIPVKDNNLRVGKFNTSVMSFFHLPEMSFISLKCMPSLDIPIQPIITLLGSTMTYVNDRHLLYNEQ